MGLEPGNIVYVDATAIIEAHVVDIWRPLVAGFMLATSRTCVGEVEARNRPGGNRVTVDIPRLRREITVQPVDKKALVDTVLAGGFDVSSLDAGEKELLALVRFKEGEWFISSQDRAGVRGGNTLGLIDRFVSLEEMAQVAGVRRRIAFRDHFTKKWLSEMRTRAILGTL
ncbi:MAG: hypothetical protein ACYC46_16215 [Acidobacteriaceae bacterium]